MKKCIGIIVIIGIFILSLSKVYAGLEYLNIKIVNLNESKIYYQILYKPDSDTSRERFDDEWYYYNSDWKLIYNYKINEEFFSLSKYKIAIKLSDGTIKTTNVITKSSDCQNIIIDGSTMRITENDNSYLGVSTLINLAVFVSIAIVLKEVFSLILKIKNNKLIFNINLLTQLLAKGTLIILASIPVNVIYILISTIVMEILMCIVERLYYAKKIKDISKNKLNLYCIGSNILSILTIDLFLISLAIN